MTTGIARDLSGKLQTRLAEVLERELRIAQHVLGPHELGEVMIEAASLMARTSAAIAGFAADDPVRGAGLFNASLKAIATSIEMDTGEALKDMERRA